MDIDFSKLWLAAAGGLVGAIAGGWVWAQRAAAIVNAKAQQAAEDDALIQTAKNVGTASLAAAIQGAIVGAVIGVILVLVWFYFTDPDRVGMKIRRVDTGDDRY